MLGDAVATVQMDITQPEQRQRTFFALGRLDHLILAAGSRWGLGAFASVDLNDVRQGFEEKVFPQFAAAQTLVIDGGVRLVA